MLVERQSDHKTGYIPKTFVEDLKDEEAEKYLPRKYIPSSPLKQSYSPYSSSSLNQDSLNDVFSQKQEDTGGIGFMEAYDEHEQLFRNV